MVGTSWVYGLKKDALVEYLEEFQIDAIGTVEELRKRLSQFVTNSRDNATYQARLQEIATKHGYLRSEDQARAVSPGRTHPESEIKYLWPDPTSVTTTAATMAPITTFTTCANGPLSSTQVNAPAVTHTQWLDAMPREHNLVSVMDKVRKWSVKYQGGEGAIVFIERLEELAAVYNLERQELPRLMSEFLQGRALTWYRCNKKPGTSWADFKQEFFDFFLPPRYFETLEDNVRERMQGPKESFKEYTVTMQDLMRHTDFSERQKLDRIFRNSRQEYQLHIKRREFDNLQELIALAGDFEAIKATTPASNSRPAYERNRAAVADDVIPDARNVCRRCGLKGHFRRECRNRQILFCWQCGKTGTRTVDCCRRPSGNEQGTTRQPHSGTQR